jgi:hypothetical protein
MVMIVKGGGGGCVMTCNQIRTRRHLKRKLLGGPAPVPTESLLQTIACCPKALAKGLIH